MNIGENIKKCRKEKGLTQQELASKSEISRNALINYESGKRIPNLDILGKIADALSMQINELYSMKQINENIFGKFMKDNDLTRIEFAELMLNNPNLADDFEMPEEIKDFMTDDNFKSYKNNSKVFNRMYHVLNAYDIHFGLDKDEEYVILVDKSDDFSNDISIDYFRFFIFRLNEIIEKEIEYFKLIQGLNRCNAIEVNKNNKGDSDGQ